MKYENFTEAGNTVERIESLSQLLSDLSRLSGYVVIRADNGLILKTIGLPPDSESDYSDLAQEFVDKLQARVRSKLIKLHQHLEKL